MNLSKFRTLNLFSIALALIALIQYYLLTPLNTPGETYITTIIDFDNKFKLIPGFIIPYMSVYIMLIYLMVSVSRRKESGELTIFLVSVVLLWSIVNFGHGFFVTQNSIRPQIKETSFFFELINTLYQNVKPFRTLPNWHVATAVLCTIAFIKLNLVKRSYFIIAWCVLICLSPLFLKMAYLIDVIVSIPLAFGVYYLSRKMTTVTIKSEKVQEVVKAFSLESLVQSVAIGIRDESTLTSLIEGLTRIEKNLTDKDREEIKTTGSNLNPPVETLKEVINNLILSLNVERHIDKAVQLTGKDSKSFTPSDRDLKHAMEELVTEATLPFDNPKFRYMLLEIKKRNAQLINTSSVEDAAKERSHDIIFRFKSFIESHKRDMPLIGHITGSTNGHLKLSFDDIKLISRELRKPPYEISPDEIWNAFYRVDSTHVTPLGDQKNPANIISLTQFAVGKTDTLEPFTEKVNKKFDDWIRANESEGRTFNNDEMEWLVMMKNYVASFLEIDMISFNQPPFINKGGAAKAYNVFGHDLNRILFEMNEKLV
ncbi:MAG: type I restriction-modification enzyme R subunit C-terminal domain-containing protein [bacterium]